MSQFKLVVDNPHWRVIFKSWMLLHFKMAIKHLNVWHPKPWKQSQWRHNTMKSFSGVTLTFRSLETSIRRITSVFRQLRSDCCDVWTTVDDEINPKDIDHQDSLVFERWDHLIALKGDTWWSNSDRLNGFRDCPTHNSLHRIKPIRIGLKHSSWFLDSNVCNDAIKPTRDAALRSSQLFEILRISENLGGRSPIVRWDIKASSFSSSDP